MLSLIGMCLTMMHLQKSVRKRCDFSCNLLNDRENKSECLCTEIKRKFLHNTLLNTWRFLVIISWIASRLPYSGWDFWLRLLQFEHRNVILNFFFHLLDCHSPRTERKGWWFERCFPVTECLFWDVAYIQHHGVTDSNPSLVLHWPCFRSFFEQLAAYEGEFVQTSCFQHDVEWHAVMLFFVVLNICRQLRAR